MINLVRNSVSSLMLLRDFLKEEQGIISLYKDAKANGRYFDPEYYAANNPDVVAAFGNEPWVLYYHYCEYGINENRLPYEGAANEGIEAKIAEQEK